MINQHSQGMKITLGWYSKEEIRSVSLHKTWEQQADRKRGELGALIRSGYYSNRGSGGEQRAIGRIREVNFAVSG